MTLTDHYATAVCTNVQRNFLVFCRCGDYFTKEGGPTISPVSESRRAALMTIGDRPRAIPASSVSKTHETVKLGVPRTISHVVAGRP